MSAALTPVEAARQAVEEFALWPGFANEPLVVGQPVTTAWTRPEHQAYKVTVERLL